MRRVVAVVLAALAALLAGPGGPWLAQADPLPPAPSPVDDTYSTPFNTPLVVPAAGVLQNDTGDQLTVTDHTDPLHGTLAVNADGSFTYTPTTNVFGTDGFTYTVTDSAAQTATATVHVTVDEATDIHKIQHVIVVMQENRSFDSYFGTYPGADGIAMTDGVPNACLPSSLSTSCTRPYHDPHEINVGGPHWTDNTIADVNGGAMDGFLKEAERTFYGCWKPQSPNCRTGPAGDVMGYHDATEIPNYWTYAQNFVLQDRMFPTTSSWSLPAHQQMVSGWAATCASADPMTCYSHPEGGELPPDFQQTPPFTTPVYAWTDLTYLLHAHGVSWKYYVNEGNEADCANPASMVCQPYGDNVKSPGIWSPLPWFTDVTENGQQGNITSTKDYYTDAANGTLPAVSWVIPAQGVSDHHPARLSDGQAYVTSVVNAAMSGPDWNSTAIFVSWDDWGGMYDHVQPPSVDVLGYGVRVPALVISPYAKQGFIDHQMYSFDSYLKFIEDDFLNSERLDPTTMGRPDSRPSVRENAPGLGDLRAAFDFTQAPLPPLILNGRPWPAPTATSVTPASGPAAGTNTIRVHGANLDTPDTQVYIDGVLTTSSVVDDTAVDVLVPPHAQATTSIVVTTRGGVSAEPLTYDYIAPVPTLSSIAPTAGPIGGTSKVTITGSGFVGATDVSFGGVPAASFTVTNDTTIAAIAPAQAAVGPVDVTVTTAGGTTAVVPGGVYTYNLLPYITKRTPSVGSTTGGTIVTITGSGFTGATSVVFGSKPATSFTVDSDTSITAVAPASTTAGYIRVTTPNGTSPTDFFINYFTFKPPPPPPPTITSLSKSHGPAGGGHEITVKGTKFTGAMRVGFLTPGSSREVESFTVLNDTTMKVVMPSYVPGPVDLLVQAPDGVSSANPGDLYTYDMLPLVGGRTPSAATGAGGTTVTIKGSNFTNATAVTFGGTPAASFTVQDDRTIEAVTPARAPGTVYVQVTTVHGPSLTDFWTNSFTFQPVPPAVSSVTPPTGPSAGGTSVSIAGVGFTGATGVSFGGAAATFTVLSDSVITATVPPGTPGAVDVTVATPRGTSPTAPGAVFTYNGAPHVAGRTPTSGPADGGTLVTLTGSGFSGATGVLFGSVPAASYTIVSDTTITAVSPAAPVGAVYVRVTNASGTSPTNFWSNLFTFVTPPPKVTALSPTTGPLAGGTTVTITGTNLAGATAVSFGGTPATSFTVVSATRITAVTPAHAAGAADLVVTTPAGTSPPSSPSFTYDPTPAVSGRTPTSGTALGGTTVTITGVNLTAATAVKFGSVPAASFTVVNDTTITAVTPPSPAGGQFIRVTTPAGTSAASFWTTLFTFVTPPPTVTALTPASGPIGGGTTVTITGTSFAGASAVSFGGTPATSFTVVSSSTITAVVPAHAVGTADVLVTTPAGMSTPGAGTTFTYDDKPVVAGRTPSSAPRTGGTTVTITGANFTGATAVQFGATPASSFTVVDDRTIVAVTPVAPGGGVYIRVTTPTGTSPTNFWTNLVTFT